MTVKVVVTSRIDAEVIKEALKRDKRYLQRVAKSIVDRIQQLARTGQRMDEVGTARLPTLSTAYARDRRETKRGQDGTDKRFFRPSNPESNLTYTGGLLKSLEYSIVERLGQIKVELGGKNQDGISYDDIMTRLISDIDSGYDIMQVNNEFEAELLNNVRRDIARELRRNRLTTT